jgi:hypothetical protein
MEIEAGKKDELGELGIKKTEKKEVVYVRTSARLGSD